MTSGTRERIAAAARKAGWQVVSRQGVGLVSDDLQCPDGRTIRLEYGKAGGLLAAWLFGSGVPGGVMYADGRGKREAVLSWLAKPLTMKEDS